MGSLKGNISKFFAWIMVSIVIVSLAGFGIQDVILGSSGRNIATVGKEKITVNRDAITGNKLNHNCEVVIFESIGRKLVLFLILICNQNIDNG